MASKIFAPLTSAFYNRFICLPDGTVKFPPTTTFVDFLAEQRDAGIAGQITDATIRARREVHKIVADLRKIGGPWKSLAVVATAEQIGVREGRRVHGRYKVTAEDIVAGKKHADAACRVNFGFDVHNVRPDSEGPWKDEIAAEVARYRKAGAKPYDSPLGALIAADVDGLMIAGRCISGDSFAHSSYRVTGNAVPMGEAAGLASTVSLKQGRLPHEVAWAEIKRS